MEEKLEKRRKGIEKIFNIIFWLYVVNIFIRILFKVFYFLDIASVDIVTYKEILVYILATGFMFYATKLAKKGSMWAGVIGCIIGLTEFLFAGLIWQIIGALLFIDSIVYLVNYKK